MKNNPKILVTIGAFAAFFLFGVLDNLKGPAIPFIIKELGINYSLMGNVLGLEYIGFFIATLIAGIAIFRFGLKTILLSAFTLAFLGIGCMAGLPVYGFLLVTFLALGLGLGTLEIGGNSTIVLLHNEKKGMFLNLLGSFHGVGSMLVPIYAGALLSANISWRIVFSLCLIPIIMIIIYLALIQFPKQEKTKTDPIFALAKSAFCPEMCWHYVAIGCYVAAEIGLASWIVEYLYKIKGQPLFYSSISLSVYFGLITGGRILGSFIVDKIGHLPVLLWATFGAIFSLALGIYGPSRLGFFLPVTGFFFSIIFPTITASFANIQKPNIEKYLGFLFTFAGIGGMIGPWLIGVLGDIIQLEYSISVLIGYLVLMLIAFLILQLGKNRPQRQARV
jgi:FHS family glucose/mannose:H+ symporter-like MFS transporter